jgi:beta-glucosidase
MWGTTASATQVEGAAPESDWSVLEAEGLVPRSGAGNSFATEFATDFAQFADAGLPHHRMSIDWARIEPHPGERDPKAIEQYSAMLDAAAAAGIQPWVCLHHVALPGWFAQDEGGFLRDRDRARYLWSTHVDFIAETFGDRIAGWMPMNEPTSYVTDVAVSNVPDEVRSKWRIDAIIETMHLCAADAARLLRGGGAPVATTHNLHLAYRADDDTETVKAADRADDVWWASWNTPEHLEPFDLLGFTYTHCLRVDAEGVARPHPPGVRVGPLGYTPWPEGLGHILRRLGEVQPLPVLIAATGIGTDDEAWRTDHLTETLGVIHEAISDGVDVRGCFFRTGVDGYEWQRGFDVKFGLFDSDRRPRPALAAISELMD